MSYRPFNAFTGQEYTYGTVVIVLRETARDLGRLDDPRWLTEKQAKDMGRDIRPGQHGTAISWVKIIDDKRQGHKGEKKKIVGRAVVYHASQVTGFKPYKA